MSICYEGDVERIMNRKDNYCSKKTVSDKPISLAVSLLD